MALVLMLLCGRCGWFTLGEPFDRPMPNGLRTVYPLTLQTTALDVLRKGVNELPPLRTRVDRPKGRRHPNDLPPRKAGRRRDES